MQKLALPLNQAQHVIRALLQRSQSHNPLSLTYLLPHPPHLPHLPLPFTDLSYPFSPPLPKNGIM